MKSNNGLRMYFFVMYNLSGIQKGIQCGHAALEYANKYTHNPLYINFIDNHKTFILLDGGGSKDMRTRYDELSDFRIDKAIFEEPDLNHSMSAIAFIIPESIYGLDPENDITTTDNYNIYMWLKTFRLACN